MVFNVTCLFGWKPTYWFPSASYLNEVYWVGSEGEIQGCVLCNGDYAFQSNEKFLGGAV
jgi:hypothetical protein